MKGHSGWHVSVYSTQEGLVVPVTWICEPLFFSFACVGLCVCMVLTCVQMYLHVCLHVYGVHVFLCIVCV